MIESSSEAPPGTQYQLFSGPSDTLPAHSTVGDTGSAIAEWLTWLQAHIDVETPLVKAFVGLWMPIFPRLEIRGATDDEIHRATTAQEQRSLPQPLIQFLRSAGKTIHPILEMVAPTSENLIEGRELLLEDLCRADLEMSKARQCVEPFVVLKYDNVGRSLLLSRDDSGVYLYDISLGFYSLYPDFDAYLIATANYVKRSLLSAIASSLHDPEWALFGKNVREVRGWCDDNPYTMPISHPSVLAAADAILRPSIWKPQGPQLNSEFPVM